MLPNGTKHYANITSSTLCLANKSLGTLAKNCLRLINFSGCLRKKSLITKKATSCSFAAATAEQNSNPVALNQSVLSLYLSSVCASITTPELLLFAFNENIRACSERDKKRKEKCVHSVKFLSIDKLQGVFFDKL